MKTRFPLSFAKIREQNFKNACKDANPFAPQLQSHLPWYFPWLVINTAFEADRAPVHELNCALCLNCRQRRNHKSLQDHSSDLDRHELRQEMQLPGWAFRMHYLLRWMASSYLEQPELLQDLYGFHLNHQLEYIHAWNT